MGIWMDAVHEAQDEVEALRARAEAAEADLAAARADLSALAAAVGSAVVAGALAPGESLSQPSGHIIVSTVSGLRARAEAAERRAEALEAALAQARADARVLAGHWFGASGGFFIAVEGLTDTEADVLTAIANEAEDLSREGMLAVIRRALEDAATCSLEAAQTSERRAEAAEAALKQAQDDGRLMLASMGSDMLRRLDGAGRTRLEQELDRSLRDSTEDDGERVPYAELYAYRRLLALGDFFDNPRGESPSVAALPEPEWYTEREVDDENEDEDCDEDEDGADDGNDDASRAVARWEVSDGDR